MSSHFARFFVSVCEICELVGLDIIFVVDSSSSINDVEWIEALSALSHIVADSNWNQVGSETRVINLYLNSIYCDQ